jgi:hypothetical protein
MEAKPLSLCEGLRVSENGNDGVTADPLHRCPIARLAISELWIMSKQVMYSIVARLLRRIANASEDFA